MIELPDDEIIIQDSKSQQRKLWKNKDGEKVHPSQLSYNYLENALRYFQKQRNELIDGKHPYWGKRKDETNRLLKLSHIIGEIKEEMKKREDEIDKTINNYGKTIF